MIGKQDKLKRAVLWGPLKLYELILRLRVAAYETGYLKPARLASTVISIGNITVGGTGKTPFVEYVARYLKQEDHTVAVLTRGYGRKSKGRRVLNGSANDRSLEVATAGEFGDEPLMLARAMPGVPVIIDKNRSEGGKLAEREYGADVLILDDGYQHLGLERDLNILLLDATDPFGGFELAPFGRLREPLYGLRRADAVIITRADRAFDQAQANAIIKYFCGDKVPVMYFVSSITSFRHLDTGEIYEANQFAGWNAALVCGIGNPHAFADDILQAGINIVSESFFADHHPYSQVDMDEVTQQAREAGADCIITTEKDAMRLEAISRGDIPVYAARLELEGDDEVRLKSLLLRNVVLKRARKS